MPDVLLSFTGFKDPYWDDPVGGGEVEGPILSLLRARHFDRVVLFATPFADGHMKATRSAISERFPGVEIQLPRIVAHATASECAPSALGLTSFEN